MASRRFVSWRQAFLRLLVVGLAAASPLALAQGSGLTGTVLDDITGQPIGRALVSSTDGRFAQMTSAAGEFRVGAESGSDSGLELRARRPGYLPMERGVKVAAGQTRVDLRLRPEAVLTGQVDTPDGSPVRQVHVFVEERRIEDGRAVWAQRGNATANFEGSYRIAGLDPGQYRVETREFTDNPVPPNGTPRLGYPPVRLEPVMLAEGQHLQADLQLHAEPYVAVEVPIANCQDDGVSVETHNATGLEFALGADDGVIKGALPKGTYALRVSCFSGESRVGEVALTVGDTPVRTAPVTIAVGAVLPLEFRQEFSTSSNTGTPGGVIGSVLGNVGNAPFRGRRPAEVMLEPVDGPARLGEVGRMRPNPQGGSELVGVGPGQYWVHVMPHQGYVASATAGGVDLRRDPLTIASGGGAVPIHVDLRDDTGSVTGSAPAGVAEVRLLPVDNSMARERDVPVSTTGTFSASGLVPGRWLLLGSAATLQPIEFRSPAIEHQWETRGVVVDIPAGGEASATVPLPSSPADTVAGEPSSSAETLP